ncbi:MAG TPA: hypothetical protein VH166_08600 [Mycobacterium sp.]|jgi:hypothetical protein|nr:hypothetical protein [Mycobacterium sp.]
MTEAEVPSETRQAGSSGGWISRVGADWWATSLGLAITALAIVGALPKIPW